MEHYKVLNRELTLKNQELRQLVQILHREKTAIYSEMLEERKLRLKEADKFRKGVANFSQNFNEFLKSVYPDELREPAKNRISQRSSTSCRKKRSSTPLSPARRSFRNSPREAISPNSPSSYSPRVLRSVENSNIEVNSNFITNRKFDKAENSLKKSLVDNNSEIDESQIEHECDENEPNEGSSGGYQSEALNENSDEFNENSDPSDYDHVQENQLRTIAEENSRTDSLEISNFQSTRENNNLEIDKVQIDNKSDENESNESNEGSRYQFRASKEFSSVNLDEDLGDYDSVQENQLRTIVEKNTETHSVENIETSFNESSIVSTDLTTIRNDSSTLHHLQTFSDSTINNFHKLDAPCSTPYKAAANLISTAKTSRLLKTIRNKSLKVRIKKLKPETILKYTEINSAKSDADYNKTIKAKENLIRETRSVKNRPKTEQNLTITSSVFEVTESSFLDRETRSAKNRSKTEQNSKSTVSFFEDTASSSFLNQEQKSVKNRSKTERNANNTSIILEDTAGSSLRSTRRANNSSIILEDTASSSLRPRRKAAPKNFIEPKLNTKMRNPQARKKK